MTPQITIFSTVWYPLRHDGNSPRKDGEGRYVYEVWYRDIRLTSRGFYETHDAAEEAARERATAFFGEGWDGDGYLLSTDDLRKMAV